MTPAEALNHDWLNPIRLNTPKIEKPLLARIIMLYSNYGQLLSGHFMNRAEKILGYRKWSKNIQIPLILPVVGNMGFKLHRMILNATRYSLFVDSGCKKAKSNDFISSATVQWQLLSQFSAKGKKSMSIYTLLSNSQVLMLLSKFNSSTHLAKMLAPNKYIVPHKRQLDILLQD